MSCIVLNCPNSIFLIDLIKQNIKVFLLSDGIALYRNLYFKDRIPMRLVNRNTDTNAQTSIFVIRSQERIVAYISSCKYSSRNMRFPTMWCVQPASLRSACTYAQSDQRLYLTFEYSMSVKLLTYYHLEFEGLKRGCICLSESTLVKMPHCCKAHVRAQISTS